MTPHAPREESPWRARVFWALLALGLLLVYLLGNGAALSNYDEPIYAEFIRAMHQSGDYLSLRYQGAETLQRPPFGVALYAGLAALVDGEAGLRLGPTVLSALAAFAAATYAARLTGTRWAGLITAAVAAGAPTYVLYGRLLLSDPPFVMATVVALIATMRAQTEARALRWGALALGLAFLLKSMAAVVPVLLLGPWWLAAARRHYRDGQTTGARIATDIGLFVLLAAAYYAWGLAAHGQRFWDEHIGAMLIDRASGELSPLIGIGGPGAYLRHIWSNDGALYAIVALGSVVGTGVIAWRDRDATLGVVATYALGSLILLSAISTRLPHYLLPLYPAVGLCAAIVAWRISRMVPEQRRLILPLAGVIALALFARGLASTPDDAAALPDPTSRALGRAAAALPGNAPVYSLDWYTPAFGYYAAKPWTMLHSNPRVAEQLAAMDPFLQAGNVSAVPRWPPGRFVVAAHGSSLRRPDLRVHRVLAQSHGFVLAEVSAHP